MYEILAKLMDQNNITPYRLAKETGITQATFSRWKTGKVSPSIETLQAISDYFGVTVDYLLGSEPNKKTATNNGDGNNGIPSNMVPYVPTGYIPILGLIPAGIASLAVEDIEGYTSVDVSNPEECFALRVNGDSMINAGICPGDLVIIRTQQCADNGQIVACRVNGDEATLKRFKQQGDTVILLPENPNYEPIIVPCSDFEIGYASIMGVALEVKRKL